MLASAPTLSVGHSLKLSVPASYSAMTSALAPSANGITGKFAARKFEKKD
jgi:hypothetical protein